MSNQTRAKDVQGAPLHGGRYASPTHPADDSVTLPASPPAPTPDKLLEQSWVISRQMDALKVERNEVLMQATLAIMKEQHPDAVELRVRTHNYEGRSSKTALEVAARVDADGTRVEAGDGTINTDNWQHRASAGQQLSVSLGFTLMDGMSAITKDGKGLEDRFGYDEERNEVVIPLG